MYTAVRKEGVPQVLLPEEEKIIVEETKSNGQMIIEEKYVKEIIQKMYYYCLWPFFLFVPVQFFTIWCR